MISAALPALLLGTALVAVPIVLHLLMRQQPKHLEFPPLRFIVQREMANKRRLRLRHLLLLLLRCAIVAFLAFALARVRINASGLGDAEAPVAAAIVVDSSPRMQYRHDNATRLEQAKEMAAQLLKELPADSDVAVLDAQYGSGSFAIDRGAADQRIATLKPAAVVQPLSGVLEEALRLVDKSPHARKEIYIFTDLARSAWPAAGSDELKQLLDEHKSLGLYLVDIGVEEPTNWSLGDVRMKAQVLSRNQPLLLETSLACQGGGGERTVELYVLDEAAVPRVAADGRPEETSSTRRDRKTISLEPGESQQLSFRVDGLPAGTHQGFIKIVGSDGLAADDYRFFTVEIEPARDILIAASNPAQSKALFLTQALAPAPLVARGEARFNCKVIAQDELARYTTADLSQFDAVALVDPAALGEETAGQVVDYVKQGGGLAVFLGRQSAPIDQFYAGAAEPLSPGQFVPFPTSRPDGDAYLRMDRFDHPAVRAFEQKRDDLPWDLRPVFKYWRVKELAPGTESVISYSTGDPALLDKSLGRGQVVTLTTPVSDALDRRHSEWNWLTPINDSAWLFAMLANETMLYLVGQGHETLNYAAGANVLLRTEDDEPGAIYLLTTPLQDRVEQIAQQGSVSIGATEAVGNYRLQRGGKIGGYDRGFSVNLPDEITRLERTDQEALDELLGEGNYRIATSGKEIVRGTSEGRVGRELFPILIVLVAVFMAVEFLVSSLFYRGNDAASQQQSVATAA